VNFNDSALFAAGVASETMTITLLMVAVSYALLTFAAS
jgi:hypothetical protein